MNSAYDSWFPRKLKVEETPRCRRNSGSTAAETPGSCSSRRRLDELSSDRHADGFGFRGGDTLSVPLSHPTTSRCAVGAGEDGTQFNSYAPAGHPAVLDGAPDDSSVAYANGVPLPPGFASHVYHEGQSQPPSATEHHGWGGQLHNFMTHCASAAQDAGADTHVDGDFGAGALLAAVKTMELQKQECAAMARGQYYAPQPQLAQEAGQEGGGWCGPSALLNDVYPYLHSAFQGISNRLSAPDCAGPSSGHSSHVSSHSSRLTRSKFASQEDRISAQRRRNRQSAQAHRERQKRHMAELAGSLHRLVVENESLVRANLELYRENSNLKEEMGTLQDTAGVRLNR